MKIGIYTGRTSPTSGGAHTLIETIRNDILSMKSGHEIVFLFEENSPTTGFFENGIKYINFFSPNMMSFFSRAKRKLLKLVGKYKIESPLDNALIRENVDILWILGPYNVKVSIPYIFTVWDLGHRSQPHFPEVSTEGWTWNSREETYQSMLYRASYVITGNEAGKKEILENYPMNPDKIKIVPFPVPHFCYEELEIPNNIEGIKKPFVFYPAQFWAHKNHIALVEAIEYLRISRRLEVNCYFVGSDQGNAGYIDQSISSRKLDGQIRNLGFVDTATLRYLYKNALAMTFVSLLGPNNLPPLEAAALGCPLIISDLPGHIEEMEGAALAVDATDFKKLGEAIYSVYADDDMRNDLIKRGIALSEKYRHYSYFQEMLVIFDSFSLLRKTWN